MRGIDQITKELASEREERDYTEGRIAVWSRELADMAPTDHGRTLGLRLRSPQGREGDLADGDILFRDESGLVAVSVEATDVLVIAPRSVTEMGVTAHALGNRHLQAQFFDASSEYDAEVMVVQFDHTVTDYLDSQQVPYRRQARVLPVPFRHAEHTH